MDHSTSIESGIIAADAINDLNALITFGLFQVENSEPQEFMALKDEWCTMLYMMKDKLLATSAAIDDIQFDQLGEA